MGKSPEDIRELLHIENDFPPEEEKAIRDKYPWEFRYKKVEVPQGDGASSSPKTRKSTPKPGIAMLGVFYIILRWTLTEDEDHHRRATTTSSELSPTAKTFAGAREDEEITNSYCLAGSGGQLSCEFQANPGRTKPVMDNHREALVSLLTPVPASSSSKPLVTGKGAPGVSSTYPNNHILEAPALTLQTLHMLLFIN